MNPSEVNKKNLTNKQKDNSNKRTDRDKKYQQCQLYNLGSESKVNQKSDSEHDDDITI